MTGPIIEDLSRNVVAGLNWLRQNKPHIGCDTSVLNINRHGLGFQLYPSSVDILLLNTVFVRITKSKDSEKDCKINWNACTLKVVQQSL